VVMEGLVWEEVTDTSRSPGLVSFVVSPSHFESSLISHRHVHVLSWIFQENIYVVYR
jgi:hypothetical protein